MKIIFKRLFFKWLNTKSIEVWEYFKYYFESVAYIGGVGGGDYATDDV